MTQSITVQLSSAGVDTGPFDITDSLANTVATSVLKSTLLSGKLYVVDTLASYVKVQSSGLCTNYVDIPITSPPTTTTTTTTMAPVSAYVYFTNRSTSSNRGASAYFSIIDYYNNPPFSINPPDFLNTSNLGVSPNISITVNYWTGTTIDDGFGNYRPPDGSKSININSDALVYNTTSWWRNSGIFSFSEGSNIGALRISYVTPSYYFGILYNFILPSTNQFTRVNPVFHGGSTPAYFLDI